MTQKGELFLRTFKSIQNKRQRILDGKINCIPWGFPRFEEESPGIEQGKMYMVTAHPKAGKTQLTDWLFLYNVIQQVIDFKLDIRLKIFYFTLEMSKEEKMLSCFANILYMKEGLVISPKDLKSTQASKVLSKENLDIIEKYQPYFNKIEEVVEFVDSVRHPFGIYDFVRKYALANGTIHYKEVNTDGVITKIVDYYEANDPDEYVITIIDHIGLISSEKRNGVQLTLHESMSVLSSDYLIKLRNRFNYIPVIVQQQALAGENLEHKKAGALRPSLANLGDNKLTSRDINVAFGIFSPYKNEIPEYMGYDITKFKDNIRFLEIITSRDGGAGTICPLYFNGAVNYFKELPKPENKAGIEKVYSFMQNIKKN
jgi:hypothetical protein